MQYQVCPDGETRALLHRPRRALSKPVRSGAFGRCRSLLVPANSVAESAHKKSSLADVALTTIRNRRDAANRVIICFMSRKISTCTQQDYCQILDELEDFWDGRDTRALHHPMLINEFGNSAFVIRVGSKVIAYLFGFASQVEPVGYVHLIAVRASARRQHVGQERGGSSRPPLSSWWRSGGPQGDRNGNFKHGVWTRENVETRRAVRAHIREIRALLRAPQPGTHQG